MANVLSPIVARYSLFFSLAIFDSSWISRAKNPTHVVQDALLLAQQQYQEKAAQKLKALLIRNSSSASSASSATSESEHSSCSVLTSCNSISTAPTTACSSPLPSNTHGNGISSLTPCTKHTMPIQEHVSMASFSSVPPQNPRGHLDSDNHLDDHRTATTPLSAEIHSPLSTSMAQSPSPSLSLSPPTSLPPTADHLTPVHSNCNSVQAHDQSCMPSSSLTSAAVSPSPQHGSITKPLRQKRKSSARKRNPKSSIATLLSVALAMILLSLLHNRRQRERKRRQSLKRLSRSHSCRPRSTSPHPEQLLLTGEETSMILHFSRPVSRTHSRHARSKTSYDSGDVLSASDNTAPHSNTAEERLDRSKSKGKSHRGRRSKVEFVNAWLAQQDDPSPEHDDHTNNDPWLALSQQEEETLFPLNELDSDQHQPCESDIRQSLQATKPLSWSLSNGHRRSVSLMHPDDYFEIQNVEEEQELQWYREQYQMHHLQQQDASYEYYQRRYSTLHSELPPHSLTEEAQIQQNRPCSLYDQHTIGQWHGWEPLGLADQKRRSVNELAWDRHLYYQEQHFQQEIEAERRKIEQQHQQHQYWLYQQEYLSHQGQNSNNIYSNHFEELKSQDVHMDWRNGGQASVQVENSNGDNVARTGSLNRLRSTSLSKDTARALGLCRSTTLSALGGKKRCTSKDKEKNFSNQQRPTSATHHTADQEVQWTVKENTKNSVSHRRVMSHDSSGIALSRNKYQTFSSGTYLSSVRLANKSLLSTSSEQQQHIPVQLRDDVKPAPSSAPSTLSRKKTLVGLDKALRSLARRCSTRFSRPTSLDGSFYNVTSQIQLQQNMDRPGRSSTQSDHMNDFRPLSMGPDSLAELQQQQQRDSLDASVMAMAESTVEAVPATTVVFLPIILPNSSNSSRNNSRPTSRAKERPPIHRRVTRSNITPCSSPPPPLSSSPGHLDHPRLVSSISLPQNLDVAEGGSFTSTTAATTITATTTTTTTTVNTPTFNQPRNSMRFANGRGVDYFFDTTTTTTTATRSFTAAGSGRRHMRSRSEAVVMVRSTSCKGGRPSVIVTSDDGDNGDADLLVVSRTLSDQQSGDTDNEQSEEEDGEEEDEDEAEEEDDDDDDDSDGLDLVSEAVIEAIEDGDESSRVASAQRTIRREIVALLTKGVRPISGISTGSSSSLSTEVSNAGVHQQQQQQQCLSPLAVEAQEELLTLPSSSLSSSQGGNSFDDPHQSGGGSRLQLTEADLYDQIAFMLVPRYKYRYQPLVAR